ncbi:MAG: hypothetical protein WC734_05845 [Patescibacteria group bacterium]
MKTINSKGISTPAIIGIVVIVLLAGGLVWWQIGKDDGGNSDANTNTTITITDWDTYRNSSVGYSVIYPKTWIVSNDSGAVNIDSPDRAQNILVTTSNKDANLSLIEYVRSQTVDADVVEGSYQTPTEITINGIECVRIYGKYVGEYVDTYIPLSGTRVLIVGGAYNNAAQKALMLQITDSVKII